MLCFPYSPSHAHGLTVHYRNFPKDLSTFQTTVCTPRFFQSLKSKYSQYSQYLLFSLLECCIIFLIKSLHWKPHHKSDFQFPINSNINFPLKDSQSFESWGSSGRPKQYIQLCLINRLFWLYMGSQFFFFDIVCNSACQCRRASVVFQKTFGNVWRLAERVGGWLLLASSR